MPELSSTPVRACVILCHEANHVQTIRGHEYQYDVLSIPLCFIINYPHHLYSWLLQFPFFIYNFHHYDPRTDCR
jgi:hypothetical protein